MRRCSWATNELLIQYHDNEYGRGDITDDGIFEKICLESFSAGLSWHLILSKREGFRSVFHGFSLARCAQLTDDELEAARRSPEIVRNWRKITAVRSNAGVCAGVVEEYGSLSAFLLAHRTPEELHAVLKRRGIRQFGVTCAEEVLKCVGLLPAHEPECALAALNGPLSERRPS